MILDDVLKALPDTDLACVEKVLDVFMADIKADADTKEYCEERGWKV